jgi:hypothetical protein
MELESSPNTASSKTRSIEFRVSKDARNVQYSRLPVLKCFPMSPKPRLEVCTDVQYNGFAGSHPLPRKLQMNL